MADLMAAGAFKPIDEISFNSARFTRVEPIQPTAEQVLLARIKRVVRPGQRRELLTKFEHWKAANAKVKEYRGALKRLPNRMAKKAFDDARDELKNSPYAAAARTIENNYYEVCGILGKLPPT
jgi:hypothetical protein